MARSVSTVECVVAVAPTAPVAAALPIRVSGLPPSSAVEIRCRFADDAGRRWGASGHFLAAEDGTVDTGRDTSSAGTWTGVDVDGPFWSALPCPPGRAGTWRARWRRADRPLQPALAPLADLHHEISVHRAGRCVAHATVTRKRLPAGVRAEPVRSGRLRGTYFGAPASGEAAVVVIGGSEGGLLPLRAAQLAGAGIDALALAYFGYDDLPAAGCELPIEYFADALEWLARRTGRRQVGLWGSSRGSEGALLTALEYPRRVGAVVAWVPSPVVNTAVDLAGGRDFALERQSMWTVRGIPLPACGLAPPSPEAVRERQQGLARTPGYSFASEFAAAWAEAATDTEIAVESLRAPMLLVGGGSDALWPSASGARALARRASGSADVRVHVYPEAGHVLGVPGDCRPFSDLMVWPGGQSGVRPALAQYGGAPGTNALAARAAWSVAVDFLRESLSGSRARS